MEVDIKDVLNTLKLLNKNGNYDNIDLADTEALERLMIKQKKIQRIEDAGYHYWYNEKKKVYLCNIIEDGKRRRIERKSEDDMISFLINRIDNGIYGGAKNKINIYTFKDAFNGWVSYHKNFVGDNTKLRYDTDYKRYFANTNFEGMDFLAIKETDIKLFIVNRIKELNLNKKSADTIFQYIRNTFVYEVTKGRIAQSPIITLKQKDFHCYTTERQRPEEKTIITDERWDILEMFLDMTIEEKPYYACVCYAIKMARYTGMRVGEIAALRWDRIYNEFIHIDSSEKTNRVTGEIYIGETKNKEVRDYPITSEIREILVKCQETAERFGFDQEWVFVTFDGRVRSSIISSCLKNKCIQAQRQGYDLPIIGIHALRRTLNSKLHSSGVCTSTAAALLGHSESVNQKYYTFDITDNSDKQALVEKAMKEKVRQKYQNSDKWDKTQPKISPTSKAQTQPDPTSGEKLFRLVGKETTKMVQIS